MKMLILKEDGELAQSHQATGAWSVDLCTGVSGLKVHVHSMQPNVFPVVQRGMGNHTRQSAYLHRIYSRITSMEHLTPVHYWGKLVMLRHHTLIIMEHCFILGTEPQTQTPVIREKALLSVLLLSTSANGHAASGCHIGFYTQQSVCVHVCVLCCYLL